MRKKTAKQSTIPKRTLRTAMVAFLRGLEGEVEVVDEEVEEELIWTREEGRERKSELRAGKRRRRGRLTTRRCYRNESGFEKERES